MSAARLAPETLACDVVGFGRGWQQLDRDAALETRVLRQKHFAHAAGAEQRQEPVAAAEQILAHGDAKSTLD